jgi:histidinol-phosphate aminotransferase
MAGKFQIQRIGKIPFPGPPVLAEGRRGFDVDTVRMNLNEAPYPPSPKLSAAASAAMQYANRYPDDGYTVLASLIANRTGIPVERITFGNGSSEILMSLAMISVNQGDNAIMPSPTFPTCGKGVHIASGTVTNVPLRPDGVNDVEAMLEAVSDHTRLFYLCSPNNPTGGILSSRELEKAAVGVPEDCLLVIDEAYFEFAQKEGGTDVLAILANRIGPWVVTRSFSKAYCLAGMRVGYALCSGIEIQSALSQMRISFNISRPSIAAASAAMEDEAYLENTLVQTTAERQRLSERLEKLGFVPFPSFANFLSVRPPISAQVIEKKLAENNILVQALGWPDEKGMLRITIDSTANNDRIIIAINEILG